MYGQIGPDGQPVTTITVSRATPDGYTVTDIHGRVVSVAGEDGVWGTADDLNVMGQDGIVGTADDTNALGADGIKSGDDSHAAQNKPTSTVYTNHTSPFIDQSQSYGSDTQTTNLLREWVLDPNTGHYRPGAELLDGHQTVAYNSQYFDDAGAFTGPDHVGQTTRTIPTLNEMRAHIVETGRDDLTWDDINNLRARDAEGHVIDTNGAAVGGYVYTGEALLLDINPNFGLIDFGNADDPGRRDHGRQFRELHRLLQLLDQERRGRERGDRGAVRRGRRGADAVGRRALRRRRWAGQRELRADVAAPRLPREPQCAVAEP